MNQPNAENTIKNDTPLRTHTVNYVSGLPNMPNLIRKISMHLYENGFLFCGKQFSDLWIPYNTVIDFKLSTGYGSMLSYAGGADALHEKIININCFMANQEKTLIKFEMSVSTFFPIANYRACKELVSYMKSNGIFDKFISQEQTDLSADIMEQIAKLAELHQSGALSDEEFQSKKAELLGRI